MVSMDEIVDEFKAMFVAFNTGDKEKIDIVFKQATKSMITKMKNYIKQGGV